MSSTQIAVTSLALIAVGLAFTLPLVLCRLNRQAGALEVQTLDDAAERRAMATANDLDNQTATMRAELTAWTHTLRAELAVQTEVLRAEFAAKIAVLVHSI